MSNYGIQHVKFLKTRWNFVSDGITFKFIILSAAYEPLIVALNITRETNENRK
jgi:hypothetical protein